jgi:ABC-2 type transport system permease protein/sodium transport system permease protein
MIAAEDAGTPAAESPGGAGELGRLGRLTRKELNEILRDRRTIITLVLMPVLLYPLLFIALQQFFRAGQPPAPRPYTLGFFSTEQGVLVLYCLGWEPHQGLYRPTRQDPTRAESEPVPALSIPRPDEIRSFFTKPWASVVDVGICVRNWDAIRKITDSDMPADEQLRRMTDQNVPLELELIYLEDSAHSREVVAWLERQCDASNIILLRQRMRLPDRTEPVVPVRVARAPAEAPREKYRNFLWSLVPLVLVLMTITGAVYPAIDLTAGERERGTLEILVAAPVPRMGLLFAKYLSVLTVAVLTALVNLVMMTATLLATGLAPKLLGSIGPAEAAVKIVDIFALLLLFAAFFSAVLLALSSFARSFKEAQAYLVPLMLVSLTPGLLALKPDLELSGLCSVVPLLNIILLARDLLGGEVEPLAVFAVLLSTLLYALAALATAARIFGAEAVLNNEQGAWADLFRRPERPRRVPTLNGALLCLALTFAAYFLMNGVAGQLQHAALGLRMAFLAGTTVVLFWVLPLTFAGLGHVRPVTGFQLQRAPAPAYAAAVLLGLSLWPFVLELSLLLERAGLSGLGPEHEKFVRELVAQWRTVSPALVVLVYALVPAVFEELFFRGYLFSALRRHTTPAVTVLGSALVFGFFHVGFAFDRLVPSTLLGVILGLVCWRSGSAFPGMVLHGCHNALLVLVAYHQDEITRRGWFNPAVSDVPAAWLLAAAGGALLGGVLLWAGTRRRASG